MLPETEFVDVYCVMPESRVKLLLIATRTYSAMIDGCDVITALMIRSENNFQLTVGCGKFDFLQCTMYTALKTMYTVSLHQNLLSFEEIFLFHS